MAASARPAARSRKVAARHAGCSGFLTVKVFDMVKAMVHEGSSTCRNHRAGPQLRPCKSIGKPASCRFANRPALPWPCWAGLPPESGRSAGRMPLRQSPLCRLRPASANCARDSRPPESRKTTGFPRPLPVATAVRQRGPLGAFSRCAASKC